MKKLSVVAPDKFIVVAHGTAAEVAKAKDIIQTTHPMEFALHETEREEHSGRLPDNQPRPNKQNVHGLSLNQR